MHINRCTYVACVWVLTWLCIGHVSGADDSSRSRQPQQKHVRLLSVGNSFSRNATRYLDDLVTAAGHKLTHRSIVVGGASLELHAGKALAYEADIRDPAGSYADGSSLQQALQADAWDYVTIQQASIKSHDIATYRPFAIQLQSIVRRYACRSVLGLSRDRPRARHWSDPRGGRLLSGRYGRGQRLSSRYFI